MARSIKVVDIELGVKLDTIEGLDGYEALQGLVRLYGTPLGYIKVPVIDGRCTVDAIIQDIAGPCAVRIVRHLLQDVQKAGKQAETLTITGLPNSPHPLYDKPTPLVTIAICTRDRTSDLARCLESVSKLNYPALDIVVVDNAPSSDATETLVCTAYPNVRYFHEPRPGLNWARNRVIVEARGEIIAYTDDDCTVDPGWVYALVNVFTKNPEVMAITGLVVPYELETEAQILFELYGGFGAWFERKWYRVVHGGRVRPRTHHCNLTQFGSGANMAFRRTVFDKIGGFDPVLDVGTVTNGGGDLEMIFRVLKEGYALVCEPSVLVRHRHRSDYTRLRSQIESWGISFVACLQRCAQAYPDERRAFLRVGLWWLSLQVRRLWRSLVSPGRIPPDLIWAELRGAFRGLGRYRKARPTADEIASEFGPMKTGALDEELVAR